MSPSSDLEDLRSFLDAAAPAVLLTYRADGSADMSPVWFRVTGEVFEVVVAKSDKKYGHLQRDPRAVLMVFEAVPPFRGVKVRAEVELDEEGVEEARRAISARYLGAEKAEDFVAARGPGVVVRLPASAARVVGSGRHPPGDPMKILDQLRNRFRAQMKSRRGRSLERALAEKKLREGQDGSIWRSGKGGAHHDR